MKPRIILMIIAGLAIALGLFLAVQLTGAGSDQSNLPPAVETVDPQETEGLLPISFSNVSEFSEVGQSKMRITGLAEPGTVVMLQNRGERLRQVRAGDDGNWSVTLDIDAQPMVIEAIMFGGEGKIEIRSEEMIFRIPVPEAPTVPAAEFVAPALIIVSAPGSPTRVVQSPFGGSPTKGALTLGAVDYDDAGGVIFSGTTSENGRIRIYAGDQVIGETRIGADGRWNFIAGTMLPFGEYIVRAELIKTDNERVRISVPFERLAPLAIPQGNDGAVSLKFEPYRWQVRRSLIGGGSQSTVIFAPDVAIPDPSETPAQP